MDPDYDLNYRKKNVISLSPTVLESALYYYTYI